MVATLEWTWTESNWHEGAMGDVDFYPPDAKGGERIGISIAHAPCWSNFPSEPNSVLDLDVASGQVVWRFELPAEDAIYRSERVDLCDLVAHVGYCTDAATRWKEPQPLVFP